MNEMNLTVKKLKEILELVPDDMEVVVPVADKNNLNDIFGYGYVRSAGILSNTYESNNVLCLAPLENGIDISTAVKGSSSVCEKLL